MAVLDERINEPTPARLHLSRRARLCVLIAAALGLAIVALGVGAVAIPPARVAALLIHAIAGGDVAANDFRDFAIVTAIRGPRILLGLLVGAALGLCGGAMQALFRNPLADPGLIGVSSGAAFAAVAVIVSAGWLAAHGISGLWPLPTAAFLGGLIATIAVHQLGRLAGPGAAPMLLAGIAVNAVAIAGAGTLIYGADDRQMRDITFWTFGSLGGARWDGLAAMAPFILPPLLILAFKARALNAFLLGEREAAHMGVDVVRLTAIVALCTASAVGASVASSGVIGFVGILAPHIARLIVGGDNRALLPAAAFLGAGLLVGADAVARTAVAPAELPIGLLCSLLGAPCFLWLMARRGRLALAG